MRRRSAVLSALSAGMLLGLTTGAFAGSASADDAPTPAASPSVTADAPTTAPSAPSTSAADPDPVDLTLSTSFGNDPVAPRGREHSASFEVQNIAPAGASLAVFLPPQLSVVSVDQDGTALTCPVTGTATITCTLGALDGSSFVTVHVQVAADAPIGSTPEVDGVLTPPAGTVDTNPADNNAFTVLRVVGNAVVTQSQSVKQVDVPLGGTAPFTLTLHNDGPDLATHVMVRFTVQSNDNPRPVLSTLNISAGAVAEGGSFETWEAFSIPAGGTASITIGVTATSPAVDSALSFSASYDGVGEICTNRACLSGAPIRTFVPGTSTPPVTGPGTPGGTGPILANTGSQDRTLALVAVGLLASGGVLTAAGRRRRTA